MLEISNVSEKFSNKVRSTITKAAGNLACMRAKLFANNNKAEQSTSKVICLNACAFNLSVVERARFGNVGSKLYI